MDKALIELCEQIQALNKQAYVMYQPQVEQLIKSRIKDEKTIQHTLDGLLDFCGDSDILLLFKKLCRYYWAINPLETAEYINIYREFWDNENYKDE